MIGVTIQNTNPQTSKSHGNNPNDKGGIMKKQRERSREQRMSNNGGNNQPRGNSQVVAPMSQKQFE